MNLLYEIIEYLKRIFVTIFGGYHVHEGDNFLQALNISLLDRIIFLTIAGAMILTIWLPKLIKSEKKLHKHIAEAIIHVVIVGMIVYEAAHAETYLRGIILTLLNLLFEMGIVLFLTRDKEKENVTIKN